MCRFAYLAVAFRGEPPEAAAELVAKHGDAYGRPIRVVRPTPHSALARFGESAAVVATFRCTHCACGWTAEESEGMRRVAASLLRASDVLRVRIGIWWISNRVDEADPGKADAPIQRLECAVDAADVARFGARDSWQLVLARSGPPWPTRKLAHLDPSSEAA